MISAVILAGGTSSRLGRPKQLLDLRGRPILQHVVESAAAAGLDELMVVLGHAADQVAAALALPPDARTVLNPDYATGQASSVRVGIAALDPASQAAIVLLGDMPGIRPAHIAAVAGAFRDGAGPVVQARWRGRPGHPVLFARSVWPHLLEVQGDVGAREIIRAHPDWVTRVDIDAEMPGDVDTDEDYRRLLEEPPYPEETRH